MTDEPTVDVKAFGAQVPVSLEMLYDAGILRDPTTRSPFPYRMVLFPRLDSALARLHSARARVVDAWGVLLHGLPDYEDDEW